MYSFPTVRPVTGGEIQARDNYVTAHSLSQKLFRKSVVYSRSATRISAFFQSEIGQNVRFEFCSACDQPADAKYE